MQINTFFRVFRVFRGYPSRANVIIIMAQIIANGEPVEASVPCTLDMFLRARGFPPRSVVVELNGEAVVPSEFPAKQIQAGDRLEIVKIVAGG